MMKGLFRALPLLLTALLPPARLQAQINFDMGCVERYSDASGFTASDNVSLTCDATDGFAAWFRIPRFELRGPLPNFSVDLT